jgi:hypothetical protein
MQEAQRAQVHGPSAAPEQRRKKATPLVSVDLAQLEGALPRSRNTSNNKLKASGVKGQSAS